MDYSGSTPGILCGASLCRRARSGRLVLPNWTDSVLHRAAGHWNVVFAVNLLGSALTPVTLPRKGAHSVSGRGAPEQTTLVQWLLSHHWNKAALLWVARSRGEDLTKLCACVHLPLTVPSRLNQRI